MKLRFGVITEGVGFEPWQLRCLAELGRSGDALPASWWTLAEHTPAAGLVWRAARRLRRRFVRRGAPPELLALPVSQRIQGGRGGELLPGLREQRLDFLLHFGDTTLPDEVLAAPRAGVWAFRNGGAPAGFWEVDRGEAITRTALVRLGPRGAEGELRQATLRTAPGSFGATRAEVLRVAQTFPAEVARELATQGACSVRPIPARPAPCRPPGDLELWHHLLHALPRRLRELARRAFTVDLWNVGLVEAPIHAFLRADFRPEITWLPARGSERLSADPFALEFEGRTHVLYESLDFAEGRGLLVARELGEAGFGPERPVLRLPFHLSYPYLLRRGAEVYCIPESCEAGEVSLYRAAHFPEGWERVASLLSGFAGVDSTILEWNGRWWCFTTEKGDAHASKLKLFHAPDLFGPWVPHRRNPVKIDVRSARGGGTPFVWQGELYRPAQDYSRVLEGRLTLNRVVVLDEERFEEEPVASVGPFAREPYPDKCHTLCAVGARTLLDGCREVSVLTHPRLLGFKLRRALAWLGLGSGSSAQGE